MKQASKVNLHQVGQDRSGEVPRTQLTHDWPAGEGTRPTCNKSPGSTRYEAVPSVLARRLADTITRHEPGWPLPRTSILARMFNVTEADVAAALGELESALVIIRRPGQRYLRKIPADYVISLAAQPGLRTRIIPISGELSCASQTVSWRPVRYDLELALRLEHGRQACVTRVFWMSAGEIAAVSTT